MAMDNEDDLVDLDEDFSEDLMLEIWAIFSHRSLVEGWVEVADGLDNELISVRISRCDSRYHSKMRSVERAARSSSTALRLVITVAASEVRLRPVRLVVDNDRFVSECRRCLV